MLLEDADVLGSEDCLKVNIYAPLNATKESNCKWWSFHNAVALTHM